MLYGGGAKLAPKDAAVPAAPAAPPPSLCGTTESPTRDAPLLFINTVVLAPFMLNGEQ